VWIWLLVDEKSDSSLTSCFDAGYLGPVGRWGSTASIDADQTADSWGSDAGFARPRRQHLEGRRRAASMIAASVLLIAACGHDTDDPKATSSPSVALALVLTYRSSGVSNFAIGAIAMFGAYMGVG
jgi:hypothetical protein